MVKESYRFFCLHMFFGKHESADVILVLPIDLNSLKRSSNIITLSNINLLLNLHHLSLTKLLNTWTERASEPNGEVDQIRFWL